MAALKGTFTIPPDPTATCIAVVMGALASGVTRLEGIVPSPELASTCQAVAALGVPVTRGKGTLEIRGRGPGGLAAPSQPLELSVSAAVLAALLGALSSLPGSIEINLVRPELSPRGTIDAVLAPLLRMGVMARTDWPARRLWLTGTDRLVPIETGAGSDAPIEIATAVLIAGLAAPGTTSVIGVNESAAAERFLTRLGATLSIGQNNGRRSVGVEGQTELTGSTITIPGSTPLSLALVAAAAIVPGSDVTLGRIPNGSGLAALVQGLTELGADIAISSGLDIAGEPHGRARVRHAPLAGTDITLPNTTGRDLALLPLVVAAATAAGTTRMMGLAPLSSRRREGIETYRSALAAAGTGIDWREDTLIITGGARPALRIDPHSDPVVTEAALLLDLATSGIGALRTARADDSPRLARLIEALGSLRNG